MNATARGDDWEEQLSVVIPAYNEENGIRPTLEGLRAALPKAEVIVVDDGSRDATLDNALAVPGVRVISHAYNRGYGAALKTGMRLARRRYVAWFDADNEHRVSDLAEMARRIATEDLAAVIGRRLTPGVSVVRTTGKLAIRLLARSLGVDLGKDLNCGLRIFRRGIICRYLDILPDAFSASMTSTMVFVERGYRLGFHDIEVNRRIGHSKVKIRDGFSTMVLVLRFVTLFAPLRMFFLPGMLFLFTGVAYGAIRAIADGRGVPVASLLVAFAGLLGMMLGLVADQISQLRLGQLSGLDADATTDVVELTRAPSLLRSGEDDAPSQTADNRNAREHVVESHQRRSE